jgi:hypothetical protein
LVSTNSLVLSKNKTGIIKCWRRFAILIAEMDQNIFHIMRTPVAPPSTSVATPSQQSGATSVVSPAASPPEFVTPLENDEERLDAANGELHVRYHAYDNIIGAGEHVSGLATRNLIKELNLMSTGEPCTFAEAEQDAAWQAAMQKEIDSIKRNQT